MVQGGVDLIETSSLLIDSSDSYAAGIARRRSLREGRIASHLGEADRFERALYAELVSDLLLFQMLDVP
jgi:hypothetical protein